MCDRRAGIPAHRVWSDGVCRAGHRTSGHHGEVLLVVDGRLRVQAFLGPHVSQGGIRRGLREADRRWMCARVVTDQVQMLARGRGDAERLLHEPVRLVAVAIRTIVHRLAAIVVAASCTVRGLSRPWSNRMQYTAASTLALHLTISQKASRHATCAPRLSIRPPPHSGFPLVPNKD